MPWRFGTRHKLHVSFVDDGKHVEETETTVQIHIAPGLMAEMEDFGNGDRTGDIEVGK